ncbi:unnamed protein product [Cylindrotheca closterium]|uniref:Uncharacterized protein n=1 Tax=Cylindrotheca closterium TaxID=2856 RepID=A0AAD2G9Y8_9STRA|nr:unnamed protein product [Cylindrotheca closterium]
MSNPIQLVEATALRDDDELEGTLLPASFPVAGGETVPLAATAYPIDNFEYNQATMARAEAQYQQEEQTQQEAYPLEQNERTALSDDSRTRVKYGARTGMIQQEAENEAIRRSNRKVFTHDYRERQLIKEANRKARTVDTLERMGRTPAMTENRQSTSSNTTPARAEKKNAGAPTTKKSSSAGSGYKMGGYEVKEYNIGSYDCGNYNISEYKSVYD